jgi:NADH-quinone oxidoreductase subunit M
MVPWVLLGLSGMGAILCRLFSPHLYRMKICALLTTMAGLVAVIGFAAGAHEPLTGVLSLCLLPLAAFVSLLSQPLHPEHRPAWIMTLLLLGLGQAILSAQDPGRTVLLIILVAVLCGLLYRSQHSEHASADLRRGLSAYGFGFFSTLVSFLLPAPAATLALLMTCATLLPLLPLHSGFIGALIHLPANLPAFVAVLLPALGFHTLLHLLPALSGTILQTLMILAVAGAFYGSLGAIAQSRILPRLVYGGLALLSISWWYVAGTGAAPIYSEIYLNAVSLAISGLLLARYAIRARYGDMDTKALSGLAYPMPRFSTLFALLALAALGMPPFGVFAGFMGMLLHPVFVPSVSFAFIMLIWLSASWYLLDVVQQLVFGRQRTDLYYQDLCWNELFSLMTVVVLLVALGTLPSRLFQSDTTALFSSRAVPAHLWTR